jgi:general secretion pathway protein D
VYRGEIHQPDSALPRLIRVSTRRQRCFFAVAALLLLGGRAAPQAREAVVSSTASTGVAASVRPTTAIPRLAETQAEARPPALHERLEAQKCFLTGTRAFEQNRLTLAEHEFLRAQKLDPTNPHYALSVRIARQFRVKQLIDLSDEARQRGNQPEMSAAIRRALNLDPENPFVTQYLHAPTLHPYAQPPVVTRENDRPNAPITLAPDKIVHSFHLRVDERQLLSRVLEAYGIQAEVSDSVAARVIPFDVTDATFAVAVRLVQLATGTFVVPLDSHGALVVADTRENRLKYEPLIVETLYFPGLNNPELNDMEMIARDVAGVQHSVVHPGQGTITVRAPEAELTALSRTYAELLEGRSEVQLDVHVYEVDRTNETNAGTILPNSATLFSVRSEADSILADNSALVQEIISSGEAAAGDWEKILAILIASGSLSGTVFNSPFVVFGGGLTETGAEWNTTAANMLLNTSDVKSLDQIQLRVLDQEEATFRVGERYPIMTSTYSVVNEANSSTQTTPQVQYTDLGLSLRAKPFIEGPGDITLHLQLELDSLAGSSLNDIPVLTDREYSGVVSVHPGDSALLVSAMSRQDSLELTGVPGLSDIPGFGDATNRQNTTEDMELVILITPHIVRMAGRPAAGPVLMLTEP